MTGVLIEEELKELCDKNLYRKLRTLESVTPTRALWSGKEVLLFCGNDYLGLSHHPRVLRSAQEALAEEGAGAGAARLISGTTRDHTHLEKLLAEFKRKEKALVFSAGYLANLGVLSGLADRRDLIVMDKLCHASLIDGARLSGAAVRVFPHKNYQKCEEVLKKAEGFRRRIIVSDSVFSMEGDLADLEELARIRDSYQGLLVIDDAHGTGVLGLRGRGAAEDLNLEEKIDVLTGTLSKALGGLGGFAAGSREMIDYLINLARPFKFATALPAHVCRAAATALEIVEQEPGLRHRLWQNVQKMHEGLIMAGFEAGPIQSPIFPLIIGDEKRALAIAERMLGSGILIPAIRYPAVARGKARLRMTVSAHHRDEDINFLMNALKNCIHQSV